MTIGDDDPITLQEACDLVYRGTIKVSTLRLEADRGNLDIFKVGRRHFTTLRSIREMREKCLGKQKGLVSTSTGRGVNTPSETESASSALAALNQITQELKSGSPNISPTNTSPPRSRHH